MIRRNFAKYFVHVIVFAIVVTAVNSVKVLVVGGSGRVGGSTARYLHKEVGRVYDVAVAGRSQSKWNEYCSLYPECNAMDFVSVDMYDNAKLNVALAPYDIIVNTAGPFQGLETSVVLESALQLGKRYVDVCDDIKLSKTLRSGRLQNLAKAYGGSAVISAGIWPGGSSLLAQELIRQVGGKDNVDKVSFSFFTAGSGGAGPTILTATFLILGEDVLTYINDKPFYQKSAADSKSSNFGEALGDKDVCRMNLIEVESCHASGIANVDAFFGTAPKIWNTLFKAMALFFPQSLLRNRSAMNALGIISLPLVRLVDKLVGSSNGIRVDIVTKSGEKHHALMTHQDMEAAVGISLAAFVNAMNTETIASGVYFPEELDIATQQSILEEISISAMEYEYSTSRDDNLKFHQPRN
jgi:hypothetical protein